MSFLIFNLCHLNVEIREPYLECLAISICGRPLVRVAISHPKARLRLRVRCRTATASRDQRLSQMLRSDPRSSISECFVQICSLIDTFFSVLERNITLGSFLFLFPAFALSETLRTSPRSLVMCLARFVLGMTTDNNKQDKRGN